MTDKSMKWFKIVDNQDSLDWPTNGIVVVEVEGKKITLTKKGDTLSACAHKCPHAGGVLAEGFIDAMGNIVCPLHGYKFSLRNGRNVSGEGYHLKTFILEERESGVFIAF